MHKRNELADQMLQIVPIFHRKMFKHLRMHEFKKGEFMLLNQLCHDDGHPMSDYGKKLVISKPNLTTLVRNLESYGWVEKRQDIEDKRIIRIFITDKGKKVLEENYMIMKNQVAEALEALSEEDIDALYRNFEESNYILGKLEDIH